MSALYVCPHCDTQWTTPDGFIAHRFDELANWFDQNGETDNAIAYRQKNPHDYQLVNGLIEKKVP